MFQFTADQLQLMRDLPLLALMDELESKSSDDYSDADSCLNHFLDVLACIIGTHVTYIQRLPPGRGRRNPNAVNKEL